MANANMEDDYGEDNLILDEELLFLSEIDDLELGPDEWEIGMTGSSISKKKEGTMTAERLMETDVPSSSSQPKSRKKSVVRPHSSVSIEDLLPRAIEILLHSLDTELEKHFYSD
nr:uncharacterized protein LOC129255099 [Lytechinus pictus]